MSHINATMTDPGKQVLFKEIMLPLYLLMQLSRMAYQKYLQNKIYLHALAIRSSNRKIYDFIVAHLANLPEPLHDDFIQLLNHYDIWMAQFDEFETKNKPALSDGFVFYHIDDQSAFPKMAEQRIFDYYSQLKQETI